MLERIPPAQTGDADPYGNAAKLRATEQGATFRLADAAALRSGPPPAALKALDTAARAHQELQAHGFDVAFDVQPGGKVSVSLVDRTGRVVRAYSPSEALDALSGESPIPEVAS
jgi:hypothetical protein